MSVVLKPRFNLTARVLTGAVLLTMMGGACAALFEDDEARRAILELRQQVDTLKRDADQKTSEEVRRSTELAEQLRRSLLDLQNQLESLRSELAKLRGQDEQAARDIALTQKEIADMQRRQKDVQQEADERFRKFEPSRVVIDGNEFLAEPSEKRDFEAGLAIFRKGEFANAQVAFVDFLNRYAQSGYRASALFWLGNAQYATKDYKEALANFRALTSQSPTHSRVPEALLAIANCQLELKDNRGARKTLDELIGSYPGSDAATAAKERLARLK